MTGRDAPAGSEHGLDATVERLGRWTAARTTRRSFLHRLGQLAVVVAAGPTIAGLLMRQAQARVCGQSGVTPKCSSFDCNGPDDVWGWCWYASDGCCANNGLKKICDCCTVDYPNVHGYCPAGTNVRCIVESCGNDPRVLEVALTPIVWEAGVGYGHSAIRAGHAIATRAVVVPDGDRWVQYIAAPLASVLGVPLLTVAVGGPGAGDVSLLRGLGVAQVLAVGPVPGTATFVANGIAVDQVTTFTDLPGISREVGERIVALNSIVRAVVVATSGLSADAAPVAAVFAALGGFPLVTSALVSDALGLASVAVGPEAVNGTRTDQRTSASSLVELSIEVADWAAALPNAPRGRVAIAPSGSSDVIGLANLAVPLVLHPPGVLGPVEGWLKRYALRYGKLAGVYHTSGPGQLNTDQFWWLQGTVNGFQVDQLQGVSGMGLPVIRQPMDERPLGRARIEGAPVYGSEGPPAYWTSQGQTFRL